MTTYQTPSNQNSDTPSNLLDRAAVGADHALDTLSNKLHSAKDSANHLSQRGIDAMRESTQQLRDTALRATDTTKHYVQDEPIKSLLIAAATGAALVALISMMSRSRH